MIDEAKSALVNLFSHSFVSNGYICFVGDAREITQGTAMSSTIASCKVIKPKVFHRNALCQAFSRVDCYLKGRTTLIKSEF